MDSRARKRQSAVHGATALDASVSDVIVEYEGEEVKGIPKVGQTAIVMEYFILGAIYILAFMVRLFSVIRYESIIHEFDPWFNFRATKHLVREGFYSFHDWFDETTWFPLGRYIGGTLYPGLMWTAAVVYHFLHLCHFPVDIRNVCVLLAPWMASNSSFATYLLTKEVWSRGAGVFAAFFIAIAPGYISRSVAGSYDNEAVAIFAMIFTFFLWVRAVRTGRLLWAVLCALGYFYMVSSWGGYIFLINIIPLHVFVLMLAGKYTSRAYCAYTTFYTVGTLLSMQIDFVSFISVSSPEHMPAMFMLILCQLVSGYRFVRGFVAHDHRTRFLQLCIAAFALVFTVLLALGMMGYIPVFKMLTGRLLSLLGFSKNIAIVKSVSEHQPSPWTTFFFDLQMLPLFVAVGLYYCFSRIAARTIFVVLYVGFAAYFASIMVRLVLVLTPAACVAGAIGMSELFTLLMRALVADSDEKPVPSAVKEESRGTEGEVHEPTPVARTVRKRKAKPPKEVLKRTHAAARPDKPKLKSKKEDAANIVLCTPGESPFSAETDRLVAGKKRSGTLSRFAVLVALLVFMTQLYLFVTHCTWVTSVAYSSPSVILMAHSHQGRVIFDDYREAYFWLRQNTPEDAKIMSWWDYGYQIKGFANRTTFVDNNTRNNSHIATVGTAMASSEDDAYPILRMLDVDYILVVFGGKISYSSDDINKFLWMVRIGGGVFPRIVEADYFNSRGEYRIDHTVSKAMRNSLMYKMCYYRFGEVVTEYNMPSGFDRVRNAEIGRKHFKLKYLEEAFTSEHWMVRIYKVNKRADALGQVDFPRMKPRTKSRSKRRRRSKDKKKKKKSGKAKKSKKNKSKKKGKKSKKKR